MRDLLYNRKKILLIILILMVLGTSIYFLYNSLSKNSDEVLVCKSSQSYYSDEIRTLYVDNKINKITSKVTYDLSKLPEEERNNIHICKDYKLVGHDFGVIGCKQKTNGNIVEAELILSVRKTYNPDIKTLQELLEDFKYTCNIEKP